jgi:hypothetical protein
VMISLVAATFSGHVWTVRLTPLNKNMAHDKKRQYKWYNLSTVSEGHLNTFISVALVKF